MTIKLGRLLDIIEGFNKLATKELPIKHAYWIGKTLKKLFKEYKELEATRNKLCMKHCKKDEAGKPLTQKQEDGTTTYSIPDMAVFNKELLELMDQEIEVNFNPIPLEQLEGINIDPATLMRLDEFIKHEEEVNR